MVKTDLAKIFAVLAAAYPKFEVSDLKLKLWFEMLKDIPYEICQAAVKMLIMEMPYPPSIADIRRYAADLKTPYGEDIDGGTAWGQVMRAIGSFGMYREEEALSSMSPMVCKAVKNMGWRSICLSETPEVIRGQFIKIYESMAIREKRDRILPEEFKDKLKQITAGNGMNLIEGGNMGA